MYVNKDNISDVLTESLASPSSPMTSSFSIAILRQPARRKQCNRLLGYVELREADIVGKIDKKERMVFA